VAVENKNKMTKKIDFFFSSLTGNAASIEDQNRLFFRQKDELINGQKRHIFLLTNYPAFVEPD
jgi:hypothetical protein